MNASKETAQQALDTLAEIADMALVVPSLENTGLSHKILRVREFLHAAKARLPREASYAKDRERRKAAK